MARIGVGYVDVKGDLSSLNKQIGAFFGGSKLGGMGKKAGLAVGVGLGAGLVAAGVGKGLFDLGKSFDEAFDQIRVGTGRTGEELDGLESDFKDVFKSLPVSMNDTAAAVTGLNQRLGITGKPLQKLSRQILQLSRITKTDVGQNVAAITRLFGDWSVKTDDQTGHLNKLFRLTQKTGIGLGDLSRLMVKFGSPLRTLGFDFDEAAAMFGRFEREGVNLQTTLPGFKIALKNFAKPTEELSAKFKKFGVDAETPRKALRQIFELLKTLPRREGTQLAFEVFGSRAASDMFRAVKEGRFEFDDLIRSMNTGSDTINKAEKDTRDFAEQWQLLKNRIFVGLSPLADKVFDTIGDGMERLATADFSQIGQDIGFGEIDTGELAASVQNVKDIIDDLGPAFDFIGDVGKRQIAALAQVFRGMAQTIKGVTQIISGILSGDFGKAWAGVKNVFGGGVKLAVGQLRFMTAPVREIAARVGQVLASAFRAAWDRVKAIFSGGARGAVAALRGMASSLGDIASRAGVALASPFRGAWGRVREIFSAGARAAGGALRGFGNTIGRLTSGPVRLLTTGFGKIAAVLRTLVEWARKAASALSKIKPPKLNLPGPGDLLDKINPFAKGGLTKFPLALVGEEGPELAKLPGGKQTILGQQGPEVRHLPVHTRVFSHTETKRKLKSVVEKVSRVLPGVAQAFGVHGAPSLPRLSIHDDAKLPSGGERRVAQGLRGRVGSEVGHHLARGLVLPDQLTPGQPQAKAARHTHPPLADTKFVPHGLTLPTLSLAAGGVVQPPAPQPKLEAADPTLQVIRVPGGQHVAVQQQGNLPPKIVRVEDSLRTLVDKPAKARVSELSTVRDRTVRSLVTEAVRRSDTKRESTSHRTSSRSSVLQRVAKQLGIQAFAKGGIVRRQRDEDDEAVASRRVPEYRKKFYGMARKAWPEVARYFGKHGGMPVIHFSKKGAKTYRNHPLLSSGVWIPERDARAAAENSGFTPTYGLGTLAHEWAHIYQNKKETEGDRKSEGGAEAFAAHVAPRVFPKYGEHITEYPTAVSWVRKNKGLGWILGDQFKGSTRRERRGDGPGGARIARKETQGLGSVTPAEVSAITQKWGVNRAVASIGAAVKDKFPAMNIISGFRDGARTKSGSRSNHAIRAALDLGSKGSLNRRIGSWVRSQFSPSVRGMSEGVLDIDHDPNPPDHADHVHVAASGTEAIKKVMQAGADGTGGGTKAKPKRITGGSLSLGQMVTLSKQAGFPDPALAAAVGYAESRGKVGAIGDGGDSIGLWQINMPAHKQYKEADLKDARKNAKAALAISKGGKNWQPWTQFRTGAYKPFLGGKSTPLPGGGGGGVTARGTSDADYLAWKLQEAEATEGTTKDDLRWINRGLRYWRKVLTRSKRAGNAKRSSEALSQITSLREKKVGLRDVVDEDAFTLDEVSSLNAGTVKWNIAGLQPQLDRLDLDIGKAALTENLDAAGNVTPDSYGDDIAAATGLRDFWQNVYDLTIGKLDLGMQVRAVQGDPSKVKRLADGRFSTKVGNRTYTFSATPGDTITVGGKKVTVPGGPELEKRPGIVLGTGKQQLEAATSLKSARDALRSVQDEMKSEAVSSADAEAKPDFAEELKKFLAAFARIGPEFGPNFKSLPSFAKGGVSRHSLALVGEQGFELAEKGRQIAAVGVGGPEIRELPVGTRVHPHDKSKRMAREMGIQGLQGGGIVAPLAAQAPARDDESLLRALARLEEAMKREPERELVEQHLHFVSPPEEQYGVQKNALAELQNSL